MGRRFRLLCAAAAALLLVGSPAAGADARRGPTDPVELGAFLDGLMAAQLEDLDIAGATVAVVRDGRVLLARGYGFADLEARKPVDPERTLFRIGSVTKLFTWTAMMQLVQQGKLDLDVDVETYLDFAIPDTFPQPITLRHLMTHTPGFEDRGMYLFGETDLERRDYLAMSMPARVRAPGTFSAYSNYGTALAGHVVERISGRSWEEYVEAEILGPLDMEYATPRQPAPERLAPYLSVGYENAGDQLEPREFEVIEGAAPAGSISASAGAMARFMLAFLGHGARGDGRILAEPTVRRMLELAFAHDERLPGVALGFYEKSSHGLRVVGHSGDTRWFHTDLALVPSENLGVFVSYNTSAAARVSLYRFLDAFLDHYYPQAELPARTRTEPGALERYAGSYRLNRGSYTTFEKAGRLATPITIELTDGAELELTSPLGVQRFVPFEDGMFRELDGPGASLTFREQDGRVTHAFLSTLPVMAFERISFLESPWLHLAVLAAVLLVFLATLIGVPLGRLLRRRYGQPAEPPAERRAGWLAFALAAVSLLFVTGIMAIAVNPEPVLIKAGGVAWLQLVLSLGVLAALLTAGVVLAAVLAWRRRWFTRWGRIRYSIFAAAALAFVLVLQAWNLLGWRIG